MSEVDRSYFHVEWARPKGILFSVVGIIGLCTTWILATEWDARIILTIIFGSFSLLGVPAAFAGGCYRSWFENGLVNWTCPSWFYGNSDCCNVSDVVEFRETISSGGGDAGGMVSHHLVLKDGTKKRINQACFGDRAAFSRALGNENPCIVFIQRQE